jgi:hypothetical protein
LLVVFRGNVDSLIHLYAVGVFLAFCMSNTGMVVHWWKTRGRGWQTSFLINAVAAILTGAVLIIVAVTKFAFGAWIVIILIPAIIPLFLIIHRHYDRVADQLRIKPTEIPPMMTTTQIAIVPIDDVNYASLRAISFARTQCNEIVVLHVAIDADEAAKVEQKLKTYAPDLKLTVVETPFRSIMPPLLAYVNVLHQQYPNAFVSIVLPEFVPAHSWERFLHNRTADQLIKSFKKHPNVAVILVPYLLEQ